MPEIECIGERMEDIMSFLHPVFFEIMKDEPTIEMTRNTLAASRGVREDELTEEEVRQRFRDQVRDYHLNMEKLAELEKYGSEREEILDTLRDHISVCGKCRYFYGEYVYETAEAIKRTERKLSQNPKIGSSFQKAVSKRTREDYVRQTDLLGILGE
jgi:hypothetical protein